MAHGYPSRRYLTLQRRVERTRTNRTDDDEERPDVDAELRLGDRLAGRLDDDSIDSVEAVRSLRRSF
jgi:hypothetical protein